MSFFNRLKTLMSPLSQDRNGYWVYARCKRCGEVISSRVNLMNDPSQDYKTGRYTVHKVLVGDGRNRCFQRIEITLVFDKNKKLVERSIAGGDFLDPNEVAAARAAYEQAIAEAKARAEAERRAQAADNP